MGNGNGIKDINLILEKVIEEINEGKDKIFSITESLKNEFENQKQELEIILVNIKETIREVDQLEKKDREMRNKLAKISANLTVSDELVKKVYNEALETKVRYITKQKEERELRGKRDKIEISLKNYLKNIEEAESVVCQVNVVLNYLCGDLGKTVASMNEKNNQEMVIKQTLEESIQDLIDTFSDESNINIKFKMLNYDKCNNTVEIGIYRIVQELICNVKKHSKANYVEILIEKGTNYLFISFKDDGVGFNLEEVIHESKLRKISYGIVGILDRVEGLGGKVDINSRINQGTKYRIKVPIIRGSMIDDKYCNS